MICGTILTNHAIEKYKKETYNYTQQPSSESGCLPLLILSVIILVIEIALLYYAITVAVYISKSSELMFVNVVLAITMTLPYLLLNLIFNPSARAALGETSSGSMQFSCGMF